jgi:hypothetical protein
VAHGLPWEITTAAGSLTGGRTTSAQTAVDDGLGSERHSTGSFNDSYRTSTTCGRSETNGDMVAAASTQRRGAVLNEGKTWRGDLP